MRGCASGAARLAAARAPRRRPRGIRAARRRGWPPPRAPPRAAARESLPRARAPRACARTGLPCARHPPGAAAAPRRPVRPPRGALALAGGGAPSRCGGSGGLCVEVAPWKGGRVGWSARAPSAAECPPRNSSACSALSSSSRSAASAACRGNARSRKRTITEKQPRKAALFCFPPRRKIFGHRNLQLAPRVRGDAPLLLRPRRRRPPLLLVPPLPRRRVGSPLTPHGARCAA
jgi:hypothetical protein